MTLHQVLEAITKVADKPMKYSVEDYGIVFTGKTKADPATLHTRWFKTTDSFRQAVTNTVLPEAESDESATAEAKEFAQLRYFLGAAGIDVRPPKNVFYKREKGMLMVRAELQELNALEALIEGMNGSEPIPAPNSVALSQQRERINTLRQKYTDAHPLLQAELEKLRALETGVQAGTTPARPEERSRFEVRLIRETPSATTTRMPLAPYLGATAEAVPEILNVDNQPLLDVAALALATVESKEKPDFSKIQLFLTAQGRSRFARITKAHIGDRLGILLEGRLVSAPRIRAEIAGGTAAITGNFSRTEAKALVARLNRFVISDPVVFTLKHDGDLQFQGLSLADPKLRDSIFQTISGLGVMASLQISSPVTDQQKASRRDIMQAMAENGLALLRSDLTNDN